MTYPLWQLYRQGPRPQCKVTNDPTSLEGPQETSFANDIYARSELLCQMSYFWAGKPKKGSPMVLIS